MDLKSKRPRADPMSESRPTVMKRSQGMCEKCGAARATDMHHRKLRRHGDHAPANLVHLCRTCHNWAHQNPAEALLAGFICPSWENPRKQPMKHAWMGRVLLDDEGNAERAA